MAKENIKRTTLHVNQVAAQLQKLGLSALGARQAASGQMVFDQHDRDQLAKILGGAAQGGQVKDINPDAGRPV